MLGIVIPISEKMWYVVRRTGDMDRSVRQINGCDVTISFTEEADPKSKEKVLWLIIESYKERIKNRQNIRAE